jgi:hypothetical protein
LSIYYYRSYTVFNINVLIHIHTTSKKNNAQAAPIHFPVHHICSARSFSPTSLSCGTSGIYSTRKENENGSDDDDDDDSSLLLSVLGDNVPPVTCTPLPIIMSSSQFKSRTRSSMCQCHTGPGASTGVLGNTNTSTTNASTSTNAINVDMFLTQHYHHDTDRVTVVSVPQASNNSK